MSYKNTTPLSQRESESERILAKYPNIIPVIVESRNKDLNLKKNKFLVPYDVSSSHLLYAIRKQLNLDEKKSIFMFYDEVMISTTQMMSDIYEKYKEKNLIGKKNNDKFLYINVCIENTFG
jgi:hypothetical protein